MLASTSVRSTSSEPTARPATLRGIERRGSGRNVAVLMGLDNVPEFEVQRLDDPPRIVVDLKHTHRQKKRQSYGVDAPNLRRVRVAEQGEDLRAVFDLATADVDHQVESTPEGLLVRFTAKPKLAKVEPPTAKPTVTVPPAEEIPAKAEPKVAVSGAFPESSHKPIVYPMALTAGRAGGKDFADFLKSAQAKAVFETAGFIVK